MAITFDQYRDICNYKVAKAAKKKCRLDGSLKTNERNGGP